MAEKVVNVDRQTLKAIRQDAEAKKPEEACGLLVGNCSGSVCKVDSAVPMVNKSKSPVRFSIDPEEMYRVLQDAEKSGMTVIGSYHSHPSGDTPSCLDEKYMEHTAYVWMIVPVTGKVRVFTFEGGVKEMKMEEA